MKKLLVLLLSAVLALGVLAACGRKIDTDADGVSFNQKNGEMYIGSKEGKERIKISYSTGCGTEWAKAVGKKFLLENDDVYLVLDADSNVTDPLGSKLDAGVNLSDVYFTLNCTWQAWAAKGYLEPLNDVYGAKPDGETGKTVAEKHNGEFAAYGKHEVSGTSNYYVMPWNQIITGFVYNDTMFQKYGWKIPETVDDMVALCDQILKDTGGTVTPFVYPGSVGGYFPHVAMNWWLQSSGVEGLKEYFAFDSTDVFDPEAQPSLGKLEMLEAFSRLFGYNVTKYSLSGSMSKNHIAAQTSFINGQAAMIPNGDWMEVEMKDILQEAGISIKMMNVPYLDTAQTNEDGSYRQVNYGVSADVMMIPKKAKNVAGAKRFLQFFCREDILQTYTVSTGRMRPLSYDTSSLAVTDFAKSCMEIWKNSETFFDSSISPVYINGYASKFMTGDPFSLIVTNKTTPAAYCSAEYDYALENWSAWTK